MDLNFCNLQHIGRQSDKLIPPTVYIYKQNITIYSFHNICPSFTRKETNQISWDIILLNMAFKIHMFFKFIFAPNTLEHPTTPPLPMISCLLPALGPSTCGDAQGVLLGIQLDAIFCHSIDELKDSHPLPSSKVQLNIKHQVRKTLECKQANIDLNQQSRIYTYYHIIYISCILVPKVLGTKSVFHVFGT